MAEYIEKRAALDVMRKIIRGEGCDCEVMPVIFEALQRLPAENVVPVECMKWEQKSKKERATFVCNKCGHIAGGYIAGCTIYCPYCGRKKE